MPAPKRRAPTIRVAGGSTLGIARCVKVASLKVLDGDGTGYASSVIRAIDWAIVNRDTYNIRVLNLSLGHPVMESYRTDPLTQAADKKALEAAMQGHIIAQAQLIGLYKKS